MGKWLLFIGLNLFAIAFGIFILIDTYEKHILQDENNYVKMQEMNRDISEIKTQVEIQRIKLNKLEEEPRIFFDEHGIGYLNGEYIRLHMGKENEN
jgi:hypothetical protein